MAVKDYETKVRADVQESNTKRFESLTAEIEGLNSMVEDFKKLSA